MIISRRELFVGAKHEGGDGLKEKKPPPNYVALLRPKIMREEEEEEEETKEVLAPEDPFLHPGLGMLTNLWNQRCLAPKSGTNSISWSTSQNDFLPSRAKMQPPGKTREKTNP